MEITEMNKDELEVLAKSKGIDIDKRRKLEDLQKQLLEATGKKPPASAPVEPVISKTHLKHPISGAVFGWTQYLQDRKDMIPCDENGVE